MWIKLQLTPSELLAKVVTAKGKQKRLQTRGHMNTVGTRTHKT